MVASPEGERHSVPGLIATTVLRAERWRVHHLGADVPFDDLADFVRSTSADVVVLSVAAPGDAGIATRDRLLADSATRVLLGAPGLPVSDLLRELA